jgi:hypothetical protein
MSIKKVELPEQNVDPSCLSNSELGSSSSRRKLWPSLVRGALYKVSASPLNDELFNDFGRRCNVAVIVFERWVVGSRGFLILQAGSATIRRFFGYTTMIYLVTT